MLTLRCLVNILETRAAIGFAPVPSLERSWAHLPPLVFLQMPGQPLTARTADKKANTADCRRAADAAQR